MQNDSLRSFKIDVETDSTIASSVESDMQGLTQVTQALGQTMQVFAPLVQEGAMPLDAAKQIMLSVARRAKLGLAVEDAIEAMHQPPPKQPDPPPPDSAPQVAQIKAQSDAQITQVKLAADAQVKQAEAALKDQAEQRELAFKAQMEQVNKQHEYQLEQLRTEAENLRTATQLETQRQIADANNATQLRIAELSQNHAMALQQAKSQSDQAIAQIKSESDQKLAQLKAIAPPSTDAAPKAADYKQAESDGHIQVLTELVKQMSRPKRVVRDSSGAITGVE